MPEGVVLLVAGGDACFRDVCHSLSLPLVWFREIEQIDPMGQGLGDEFAAAVSTAVAGKLAVVLVVCPPTAPPRGAATLNSQGRQLQRLLDGTEHVLSKAPDAAVIWLAADQAPWCQPTMLGEGLPEWCTVVDSPCHQAGLSSYRLGS